MDRHTKILEYREMEGERERERGKSVVTFEGH